MRSPCDHCARQHCRCVSCRVTVSWGRNAIHNPLCTACVQARLTTRQARRQYIEDSVEGSDKGFVLGIDLIGPYSKDLSGNSFALVGVEVGHTHYGMAHLLKDK